MTAIRLLFESIPMVLAIAAIFICGNRVITTRRSHDRGVFVGMVACAALMIGAQSSWTYTILNGDLLGSDAANILWTLFNISVMLVFILSAKRIK